MGEEAILATIDSATKGIETLQENVLAAISDKKSGWFGARIKLSKGVATVVQVTTDEEIDVPGAPRKKKRRAPKTD